MNNQPNQTQEPAKPQEMKESKEGEENELEKLRKERDDYLAGWQRAKADLINYKKDEGRRQEAFVEFAGKAIVGQLLPVLDSFELAIHDAKTSGDKNHEHTLWLLSSQLLSILKRQGLAAMETKGAKFDPKLHESVEEVESQESAGTIVEEVQKGYFLNGEVLRPARVKVAKGQ